MTWLVVVIVALVCVAFSAGFAAGGIVALGIRARRPPVGGSYPRQAANALRLAPRPLSGPVGLVAPGSCEPPYDFEAEDCQ
jgi:hypothetical protein